MYREEVEIMAGESLEEAVERCKGALLDRMWREVWREFMDIPDLRVKVNGRKVIVEL